MRFQAAGLPNGTNMSGDKENEITFGSLPILVRVASGPSSTD